MTQYRRITDQHSDYYGKIGLVIAKSPDPTHPMIRLELPYGETRWFLTASTRPLVSTITAIHS